MIKVACAREVVVLEGYVGCVCTLRHSELRLVSDIPMCKCGSQGVGEVLLKSTVSPVPVLVCRLF